MPDKPIGERVASLETSIENLYEEVRGLKRAIWGGVAAVIGATIIYLMKEADAGSTANALYESLPF